MHGLGNDFMVVDLVTQSLDLRAQEIRRWSDRRTGVGFDQLLAVLPPSDPGADFRYRIFNRDGTEAEQCGNGARCFARFVRDHGLTVKRCLTLETSNGMIRTRLLEDDRVEVEMGPPGLAPAEVPFLAEFAKPEGDGLRHRLSTADAEVVLAPVSIGNPHAVIEVDDIVSAPVKRVGTAVQSSPAFPEGVNVGFLQVVQGDFARLRVYERGAGETRACGSGACAAMVAGRLRGLLDAEATVSLRGGEVSLRWPGEGEPVTMTGPTAQIYDGQIRS
ncbi:MAG: diaminopimelate epimerase [Gammaproteobacteria bacterium]|nr:diaminopimelate epimerase [Gammaproteobacteria bacterium]